jgi:pimeloyl-ACP methyl ester carboxylesterase
MGPHIISTLQKCLISIIKNRVMKVYGISGLGADERVYQQLNQFLVEEIRPLKWIQPIKKENLEDYLQRFKVQIDENQDFILIGVSFGGMIAVELNKYTSPQKTIIISSNATKDELPRSFFFLAKLNLIRFIPHRVLKPPMFLSYWLFGVKSKPNKHLLKSIIKDTDQVFLKWAIQQIVSWKNTIIPSNLSRIHGTNDRVLQMNKNKPTISVKGGGHFMVIENAEEIARHIEQIIG